MVGTIPLGSALSKCIHELVVFSETCRQFHNEKVMIDIYHLLPKCNEQSFYMLNALDVWVTHIFTPCYHLTRSVSINLKGPHWNCFSFRPCATLFQLNLQLFRNSFCNSICNSFHEELFCNSFLSCETFVFVCISLHIFSVRSPSPPRYKSMMPQPNCSSGFRNENPLAKSVRIKYVWELYFNLLFGVKIYRNKK